MEKTFDAIALRRSFPRKSWLPAWASNKVTSADSKRGSATVVEIWHVAEALGVRPAALFRGRAQPSKSTAKQTKTGKPIIQI